MFARMRIAAMANAQPMTDKLEWNKLLVEDIQNSGLNNITVSAALLRPIDPLPLIQNRITSYDRMRQLFAYRIPYFNLDGTVMPDFYRVKFVPPLVETVEGSKKEKVRKYFQPAKSVTHAYIPPPQLIPPSVWQDPTISVIITEGEKKALKSAQQGFPTIGLGGVNSWRIKNVPISKDQVIELGDKLVINTTDLRTAETIKHKVVPEFLDIKWVGRRVLIIFDSDPTPNENVVLSSFELGLWLEDKGALVSIIHLPQPEAPALPTKVGLDDYLLTHSAEDLQVLVTEQINNFPVPSEIKQWIQEELDARGLKRGAHRKVARAILAALDTKGQRYRDTTNTYHYFDSTTKRLHSFRWDNNEIRQLRLSTLGTLLMREYGIGTTDSSAMSQLADMFTARAPIIEDITPRSTTYSVRRKSRQDPLGHSDRLYYQISDNRMAVVLRQGIKFADNGTDKVLFMENPQVLEQNKIQEPKLFKAIRYRQRNGLKGMWYETLKDVNLSPPNIPGFTLEHTRALLACLFHLSPWLNRWNRLMLPLELSIAEPGSGKTQLQNLRRAILTGSPSLDSPPEDMRSWYASISKAPGIWVCDNMGKLDRSVRERLSDELARMLTEPNPSFELRQLFTTATVHRGYVNCTFAITAIANPFTKPDILQRSILYTLKAIPEGQRNGAWYEQRLGDRHEWVAEHLVAIQNFFTEVGFFWNENYRAKHRLTHFEQSLILMGHVLGLAEEIDEVIPLITENVHEVIAHADSTMEALRAFADEQPYNPRHLNKDDPAPTDVVDWARDDLGSRFSRLPTMSNAIMLGRYLSAHKSDILSSAGIEVRSVNNTTRLRVLDTGQWDYRRPESERKDTSSYPLQFQ
jgi:hypothetical protein